MISIESALDCPSHAFARPPWESSTRPRVSQDFDLGSRFKGCDVQHLQPGRVLHLSRVLRRLSRPSTPSSRYVPSLESSRFQVPDTAKHSTDPRHLFKSKLDRYLRRNSPDFLSCEVVMVPAEVIVSIETIENIEPAPSVSKLAGMNSYLKCGPNLKDLL